MQPLPGRSAPSDSASTRRAQTQGEPVGLSPYARYAWGVLAANLVVILWGAFVRATGSGAGCGSHWPLCNGEVVPRAPAIATVVEFTHRLTSGLALVLIAGLFYGSRSYPPGHPVRRNAALAGLLIVSEALIGAGLVLLEHVAHDASLARGYWVAGHLTNTFLLVAALSLTAWSASRDERLRLRGRATTVAVLGAALAGMLVLGVSGAITALGDTLFPSATLAEAEARTFSESAHVFVRLRVWHPALAVAVGLIAALALRHALRARPLPIVARLAGAFVGLYAVQLALGVLNVWLLAPVPVQIAHLLLSDLCWIALVLLAAATLADRPLRATGGSPAR